MRQSNELQIGKAGEYLACSDLIRKGFVAFPSEQGLPYDIVLDTGKKLLRCQVKTTETYRKVPQRNKDSFCYIFHVKRHGNQNNLRRYDNDEVDLFALVFLDSRRVGYVANISMPDTLNIRVPELKGQYYDEKGIADYKKINILIEEGKTQTEISKTLGIHISRVNRLCASGYAPFQTKARYVEDYERDKDWFLKF